MKIGGLLRGAELLRLAGFPHPEFLGPDATLAQISRLLDRHGMIFVKPAFPTAVGRKGKAGLVVRVTTLEEALAQKERLYFAHHDDGRVRAKANGVTFEAAVPSQFEIYFSLSDSTRMRQPAFTLSIDGGVDIEDGKAAIREVPFCPVSGLTSFLVAEALRSLDAPAGVISPLARLLPGLWTLIAEYGVASLELNPIRMRPEADGRLLPVACDFKCAFDRDDPRTSRAGYQNNERGEKPGTLEARANDLRTHQGQSDVTVINPEGTVLPLTFGGGANSLVTEALGGRGILSSDFGGNPPFEKMQRISTLCFDHFLRQSNVLLVIGGKSNNTDILVTFSAIAHALKSHLSEHGPTPLFVVVGRGGPNVVEGMAALAEVLDQFAIPYRFFGHDSAMTEVVSYALAVDDWMARAGRSLFGQSVEIKGAA